MLMLIGFFSLASFIKTKMCEAKGERNIHERNPDILESNQNTETLDSVERHRNTDTDIDIVHTVQNDDPNSWRNQSAQEFRIIVVQQTLNTILETPEIPDLTDERTKALFLIVRDIEFDIFRTANNRGEYYHYACATAKILEKEKNRDKKSFTTRRKHKIPTLRERSIESERQILQKTRTELNDHFNKKYDYGQATEGVLNSRSEQMTLQQIHGEHETGVKEASCENSESNKIFKDCSKYHDKLIPVDEFTLTHLPSGFQNEDLYNFIKNLAEVTVHLTVSAISPNRQAKKTNTELSYPFSENTGTVECRYGTGRVCNVTKHSSERSHFSKYKVCPCVRCRRSHNPSREWGEVLIFTAAHVVYDNLEAGATWCRFFYDSVDAPETFLQGLSIVECDPERDWCRMKCASCDMDLIHRLETTLSQFFRGWFQVYQKYRQSAGSHRLAFIVSHPHGESKCVSIGQWSRRHDCQIPFHTQYSYDCATCPGSSGATVHLLGVSAGDDHWFDQHIHYGFKDADNISGTGWENVY
ncbi:hypothetical protein Btru_064362 [Bulinus truncatus]|nr:hypothetical protein Btru_064362 [Bulinus truncatus]